MSVSVTLDSITYTLPTTGDVDWGDEVTPYLVALATSGGSGGVTLGTANGLSLAGSILSLGLASTLDAGAMSAAVYTRLVNTSGVNTGDSPLASKNEGVSLTSATTSFDFVGAGINATNIGGAVTVTVAAGGGLTVGTIGSVPNANALTFSGGVLNVEPASASFGGVVTTGTQTFAGAKTFSGTISASNFSGTHSGTSSGTNTGDVTIGTASGLSTAGQVLSLGLASSGVTGALSGTDFTRLANTSGTNTGDFTLAAVGSSPNANGATRSSQVLNLELASASFPGLITAAQFTKLSNTTNTNSGDVTLAAFGSAPATEGASLSGQVLTLQPADATRPGGLSTTTQSVLGAKTWLSAAAFSSTVGVTGDFSVNTNKFTVAASSGNTAIAGTLGVTGAATLSSTLAVTGDATLSTHLFMNGATLPSSTSAAFYGFWVVPEAMITGETATTTAGFHMWSNAKRVAAGWAQVSTARASWQLELTHGSSTDRFRIARAPAGADLQTSALVDILKLDASGNAGFGTGTNTILKRVHAEFAGTAAAPNGFIAKCTSTGAAGFQLINSSISSTNAWQFFISNASPPVFKIGQDNIADYVTIATTTGNTTILGTLTISGGVTVLSQTNTVTGITNKTFTSPTINGATLSGSLSGGTFTGTTLTNPTVNAATLTGTIAAGTSTISGTPNFSGAATLGGVDFLSQTNTVGGITNKTFTSPTINAAVLSGTLSGNATLSGNNTYSGTSAFSGVVTHTSGIKYSNRSTTAATVTHATTDGTIFASANAGAVTVNLVAVSGNAGLELTVIKTDASLNTITLDGASAETINGAATKVLTTQYDACTIITDGTAWYIK